MAMIGKKHKKEKKKHHKKRKGSKNAFGGTRIVPDGPLSVILRTKHPVKPGQMTKKIWQYIKAKGLLKTKKKSGDEE